MRQRRRLLVAFALNILLLTACVFARWVWVAEPVEIPAGAGIAVAGDIANMGDAWHAMTGRTTQPTVFLTQWLMNLQVLNQGASLVTLYLGDSSIVSPTRESHNLGQLAKGGLSSSIPPNSKVVAESLRLPDMSLSPGDVISLFLVWGDSKGTHSGFWRWAMEQVTVPDPVPEKPPTEADTQPLFRVMGRVFTAAAMISAVIIAIGLVALALGILPPPP